MIDRLSAETEEFHAKADEDVIQLLGPVTPGEYFRFVVRMYGFVVPLERSLAGVRGLERVLDPRRFRKADLLRIDLLALRFTTDALEQLPQCTVPVIDTVEEALAWAYPVERSTLGYSNLYRQLAAKMPGEVAFASSYLKCYAGVIGESWRSYAAAIESVASSEEKAQRVIECARSSFRAWRSFRLAHDDHPIAKFDGRYS